MKFGKILNIFGKVIQIRIDSNGWWITDNKEYKNIVKLGVFKIPSKDNLGAIYRIICLSLNIEIL
jgi:hypothetical protein